jgi:hypothetical protein
MAAAGENPGSEEASALTVEQIEPLLAVAQQLVTERLASELDRSAAVANVTVQIADLPGAVLAQFEQGVLTLDATAAGWGWFIDSSPEESSEFDSTGVAISPTAAGRIDLLSVLVHELGHATGHADVQDSEHAEEVMTNLLSTGTRRLPPASNEGAEFALAADELFAELGLLSSRL